ncbi:IS110 family transposase [Rufibacter sediminis]|uniref:IS110 family transposase n=1 Tax=Rufibacter sediminis TaxID=2762756 RepID=A0ABR6VP44_9BACT|nr:IS110 family transposase [Rufibacter sediminis]MBC3538932.1 IS110 family transposase [Rufibacter sediminis]
MEKPTHSQAPAFILGVDVSKDSLDVCLVCCAGGRELSRKTNNNPSGFRRLKAWLKQHGCEAGPETLCCLEHTGLYTRQLVHYLLAREVRVWMESALQIKRSIGMVRGKDDKVDAQRIARYALLHQSQAKCVNLSGVTLERLKDLQANRSRLQKALQSIKVTIKELLAVDPVSGKTLEQVNKKAVQGLEKSMEQVEEKMQEFIAKDDALKGKYDLLTSVKGVGKVLAVSLLVYTQGFTRMDDGRKLACYCGVAPFEYRSGTSIMAKAGVSKFANKNLKQVLHMAALNSVRYNQEMKAYFDRKVAEGKSKMSVLNAVRNKLLHQIVAVIKRGTPYEIRLDKI